MNQVGDAGWSQEEWYESQWPETDWQEQQATWYRTSNAENTEQSPTTQDMQQEMHVGSLVLSPLLCVDAMQAYEHECGALQLVEVSCEDRTKQTETALAEHFHDVEETVSCEAETKQTETALAEHFHDVEETVSCEAETKQTETALVEHFHDVEETVSCEAETKQTETALAEHFHDVEETVSCEAETKQTEAALAEHFYGDDVSCEDETKQTTTTFAVHFCHDVASCKIAENLNKLTSTTAHSSLSPELRSESSLTEGQLVGFCETPVVGTSFSPSFFDGLVALEPRRVKCFVFPWLQHVSTAEVSLQRELSTHLPQFCPLLTELSLSDDATWWLLDSGASVTVLAEAHVATYHVEVQPLGDPSRFRAANGSVVEMKGQTELSVDLFMTELNNPNGSWKQAKLKVLIGSTKHNILSTTALTQSGWSFVQSSKGVQVVHEGSNRSALEVAYFSGCPWIRLYPSEDPVSLTDTLLGGDTTM